MSDDDSDAAEFMSFASAPRPSSATAVSVYASSSGQHSGEKQHRRSHKRRRRDGSQERSRRRHRSERVEHKQKAIAQRGPRAPSPVDLWGQLLEDGILSTDRRGDANLLLFKETPNSTAPKFVRRGGRRVLGLGGGLRIDRDSEGPIIKLVQTSGAPKRYMDVDWTSQRHANEHVDILNGSSLLEAADFVPLVEPATHGANSAFSREYDSDAEDGSNSHPNFRSMEGRAKDPPAATATASASTSTSAQAQLANADGDKPIARSEAQTKMVGLERQVSANPHDVSAWQALALLQEELVNSAFAPTTGRPKFRQRSKRAVAESQIEVYRRALRHNPESRMLVLGYFEQCSAILDDASLADEWELVLNSTRDPEVIMRYVAVLQTMSAQFSVTKVTAVYAKGIRRLQRVLRDKVGERDSAVVQSLLAAVVTLIHCACLFMRESGFTERAISVYQAVVEWYVLAPERLYLSPFSHRKRAFERFWDSGVPRIGVAGARGWSCYDDASSESATGHSRSGHSESPDPDSDHLAAWCRAEQRLAAQNALPALLSMAQLDEATIGSDDVDPNSLVVFEDVEPFIVDLPWSEDTAGLLLDHFMQFLGVVGPRAFVLSGLPLVSEQNGGSLATLDDFMWTLPGSDGSGSCESMFEAVRGLSMWSQASGDLRFPFVSTPVTLDTCDTPLPYAYSCPLLWQRSQSYQDLARYSFELLVTTPGLRFSTSRQRLLLATAEMEWSFALPAAKSTSKRLLKAFPTCLALWNTYAKLHARYGRWDEARTIWSSILVRAKDLASEDQGWTIVVRRSWAVLEILHGSGISAAVRILAATVEEGCQPQLLLKQIFDEPSSAVSPIDVLRARKLVATDYSDASVAEAREVQGGEIAHARLSLHMWLAYAADTSCAAASKVHTEWTDKQKASLARNSQTAEELATLELCSIHLYHSMTSKVHRARDLRSHLEQAVQQYPHTTVFWEMFIRSEARSKIAGRVSQRISAALAREPQSVDLQLIDVYAALSYASASLETGVYDRVRGALKRAMRHDAECWSPLVWLTSIAFERMHGGRGAAARAKRLVLGAMRRCPWVKPLYMLVLGEGFVELAFVPEEKLAVLRAVVFLGLRTRASLACMNN